MMLGDNLSDGQVRAYASRKESIYRELYRPHLQPLPGLRAFLEKSQKLGVPMALATSADEQNVALVLDGLDLRRYFSVIVAARDIQHSKPHPQVFLLAADRLGLAPADCVVFEDSQAGAESARRAGMRLVLITTSLDGQALAEICGVEIAVKDFTRLDPRCLLTP
jgi:HAD superfamily hydrolase (TIGR01509 family)